jgi:TetR/AcrR family transcriptional regulator
MGDFATLGATFERIGIHMTKADCRSRLLEVGTRLFAERGLHGVSVRELSQAAGASISMISYHFGSKEGLYSEVLQEQFACFDQIEEIRRQGAGPLAVIEGYLRWTMLRHRNNPYLLRFYTSELTNPTAWFATIVSPAIANVIRILAEVVEEGMQQGQFRQDLDAVNAALALAGMVNYFFLSTLATESLTNHSPEQDEQLICQYVAIFTTGIIAAG